jgi:Enoyl-(Acyl carrier protein) reductase
MPCALFDYERQIGEAFATKEAEPKGIGVNSVAPVPIWTPLQVSSGATMEKLEKFGSQTVFERPGQPAELASIYEQLAAADASFATGRRGHRPTMKSTFIGKEGTRRRVISSGSNRSSAAARKGRWANRFAPCLLEQWISIRLIMWPSGPITNRRGNLPASFGLSH